MATDAKETAFAAQMRQTVVVYISWPEDLGKPMLEGPREVPGAALFKVRLSYQGFDPAHNKPLQLDVKNVKQEKAVDKVENGTRSLSYLVTCPSWPCEGKDLSASVELGPNMTWQPGRALRAGARVKFVPAGSHVGSGKTEVRLSTENATNMGAAEFVGVQV